MNELVFIEKTLAATAFYYGIAGGAFGYVFVKSFFRIVKLVRSLFLPR